jgi:hypothetical protein
MFPKQVYIKQSVDHSSVGDTHPSCSVGPWLELRSGDKL